MAWQRALIVDGVSGAIREIDPGTPVIDPEAPVLRSGEGVFETIAVRAGRAVGLALHLDRLARSAATAGLSAPRTEVLVAAVSLAEEMCEREADSTIRLVVARPGDGIPAAWLRIDRAPDHTGVRANGIGVALIEIGGAARPDGVRGPATGVPGADGAGVRMLRTAKTLSYARSFAALAEARHRGADDALWYQADGTLLEGATSSLLVRAGDVFLTPDPALGILHGTTQRRAFGWLAGEGFEVREARLTVADLGRADAAWLTSSIRLAAPIVAVDGEPLPHDAGFTAALNAALARDAR